MKVLLKKHKSNGHIEIAPVYFSSSIKTVINLEYDPDKSFQEVLYRIDEINLEYDPDKSFQEVLYRIDDCINEESGWIIE